MNQNNIDSSFYLSKNEKKNHSLKVEDNPQEKQKMLWQRLFSGKQDCKLQELLQKKQNNYQNVSVKEVSPLDPTLQKVENTLNRSITSDWIAHQQLEEIMGPELESFSLHKGIENNYFSFINEKIDLRLMFQIFSDDWGSGRKDPFGKEWEGYNPTTVLNYYASLKNATNESLDSLFPDELCSYYETAHEISKQLGAASTPAELEALSKTIIDKAENLNTGKSLFVPGGWSGLPGSYVYQSHQGHALIYQVKKEQGGTYAFRVLNSGAGLQYHKQGKSEEYYQPALEWKALTGETILHPKFWQGLLEAKVLPLKLTKQRPKYDQDYIYSHIQKFLKKECPSPESFSVTPELQQQRAGSCTRKSADLIARVYFQNERNYKLWKIAKRTIALTHLSLFIENGKFPLSEAQLANEIYDKEYRKLWNAMVKFVRTFVPETTECLLPYVATLHQIKLDRLEKRLNESCLPPVNGEGEFARLDKAKKEELGNWGREMYSSALPSLSFTTNIQLPKITTPEEKLTDKTLEVLTDQVHEVVEAGLGMMEKVEPGFLIGYLENNLFSRLDTPTDMKNSVWQTESPLSSKKITAFLKELYRAVNLSFNASQKEGGALPSQMLAFWKSYAIATVLFRTHLNLVDDSVPVSWSHFNTLYHHPGFSLFMDKFSAEASKLHQFFLGDSIEGASLVGYISSPESKDMWSKVPLFDYSWGSGTIDEIHQTVEHGKFRNNSPSEKEDKPITLWRQFSQFAQQSIAVPTCLKDYKHTAESLEKDRRFSLRIEPPRYSDKHTINLDGRDANCREIRENRIDSAIFLWPQSEKLLPFSSKFLDNTQLKQGEVIKDKAEVSPLSTQENYALELISTCDENIHPHLLLSHFEERSNQLHQREYLDYFMQHLHSRNHVSAAIQREPKFFERLFQFFEKIALEDMENLTSEAALDRLLCTLYSLSRLETVSGNIDDEALCGVTDLLQKVRDYLLNFNSPNRVWMAKIANFLLASYSLKSKALPDLPTLVRLSMESAHSEQETGFDRLVRVEALELLQSAFVDIGSELENSITEKDILQNVLLPTEISLSEKPLANEDLLTSIQKKSEEFTSQIKMWEENRQTYRKTNEALEWAKGSLEEGKDPKYWSQKVKELEEQLPKMKQDIPSLKEEITYRAKFLEQLKSIPQEWVCRGHQLMIQSGQTFIEIDLIRGLIFRNGIPNTHDHLPYEIQQQARCSIFGKAIKGEARLASEGFQLTQEGFESVTFRVTDTHDVILSFEGKNYLLLDQHQKKECTLPEVLKNSEVSVWAPTEEGDSRFIICGHPKEGAPKPLLCSDSNGFWRSVSNRELHLCEKVPQELRSIFGGIALHHHESIAWADQQGNIIELDLPLTVDGKETISFTKVEGKWRWKECPSYSVANNQQIPELPNDHLHLILESDRGEKVVMMERSPIMKLYERGESKETSIDPFQLQANEKQVELFPLGQKGLKIDDLTARIYLAYRKLAYADYRGVKRLINRGLHPLGRAYTVDELKLIKMFVESSRAKADSSSDAATVRLRVMFDLKKHLKAYPMDPKTLDEQLKEFVSRWSENGNIPAIERTYQMIARGTTQADPFLLEDNFLPIEEIEFLVSSGKVTPSHYFSTDFMNQRLKKYLGVNFDNRSPESKEKEIEDYQLPSVDLGIDRIRNEYFEPRIYYPALFPEKELNWEESFVSLFDDKIEPYFRSIYNTLRYLDDSQEGYAKKKKLTLFLKQKMALKTEDGNCRRVGTTDEFWRIILQLLKVDRRMDLPELPPIDKCKDLIQQLGSDIRESLRFGLLRSGTEPIKNEIIQFHKKLNKVFLDDMKKNIPQVTIPEKYEELRRIEGKTILQLCELKGYHSDIDFCVFSLLTSDSRNNCSYLKRRIETYPYRWQYAYRQETDESGVTNFENIEKRLSSLSNCSEDEDLLSLVIPDLYTCQTLEQVEDKMSEVKKHLTFLESLEGLLEEERSKQKTNTLNTLTHKMDLFEKNLHLLIESPNEMQSLTKDPKYGKEALSAIKDLIDHHSKFEERVIKNKKKHLGETLSLFEDFNEVSFKEIDNLKEGKQCLEKLRQDFLGALNIKWSYSPQNKSPEEEEQHFIENIGKKFPQFPEREYDILDEFDNFEEELEYLLDQAEKELSNWDSLEQEIAKTSFYDGRDGWYAAKGALDPIFLSLLPLDKSTQDISTVGNFVNEILPRLERIKGLIPQWEKALETIEEKEKEKKSFEQLVTAETPPEVTHVLEKWEQLQPLDNKESHSLHKKQHEEAVKKLSLFQESVEQWKESNGELFESYKTMPSEKPLIDPKEFKNLSSSDKKALQKVIDDLKSYRTKKREELHYRIKGGEREKLLRNTGEFAQKLSTQSAVLESNILEFANKLPADKREQVCQTFRVQGEQQEILSIDNCIGLTLRNNEELWKGKCALTPEEINELQVMVAEYLMVQTELRYLQRGINLLKSNTSSTEECGQWFAEKRAYSAEAISNGSELHHLVFEYYSGMRIRQEQKEIIEKLSGISLGVDAYGRALQLIMGAGKSKLIGPILAAKAADGERLSTFCFPNSLYTTGMADLNSLLYSLFKIRCYPFEFTRKNCCRDTLKQLIVNLEKARQEGSVIVHRPKDLHCLHLMYIERQEQVYQKKQGVINNLKKWLETHPELKKKEETLQHYITGESDDLDLSLDKEHKKVINGFRSHFNERKKIMDRHEEEIELLGKILLFLQKRQDALFDEFDTIYDPKNQVSFPIGSPVPVSTIGVQKACELYFSKLPKFDDQLHISSNRQTLVNSQTFSKVVQEIEEELWKEYAYRFEGKEEGFIAYLRNENTPDSESFCLLLREIRSGESLLDQKIVEELSFWKYALTKGLPIALEADGHVSYERSKKDRKLEVVIPCEYNSTPKEGTRFKNPWEAALKTCQYYRHTWNDPYQTAKLIEFSIGIIENGSDDPVYIKALPSLFGELTEIDTKDVKKLQEYTKQLGEALKGAEEMRQYAHALISRYLATVVLPMQLKSDPVQLTSSPVDLAEIPGSPKGFSGTWAFADSWPVKIEATPTPHTDAANIDVLTKNENEKCVIPPHDYSDFAEFLTNDPDFQRASACIDVGPIFKGKNNFELAKQYLSFFKSEIAKHNGIDKQAVVFYMQNPDGSSHLALMKNGSNEPLILRDTSKETLKEALGQAIAFDQVFTLYDHAHTVGSDIFQSDGAVAYVMIGDRMTKDKFLQGVARMRALRRGGHHVKCVLPHCVAKKIASRLNKNQDELKTADILCYATLLQQDQEIPINGYSLRENLYFFVKKVINEKQLHATNAGERQKLYETYRPYLVTLQKESLFDELGQLDADLETKVVLQKDLEKVLEEVKNLSADNTEKITKWFENKIKTTPLPDKLSSKLELSEGAVEIEQDTESQEETEQQKMQEIRLEFEESRQNLAIEKEWPVKLEDPDLFEPTDVGVSKQQVPAVYRLNDCHPALSAVFDENLLVSENFLATFEDDSNAILTDTQREVHHLLIVDFPGKEQKGILLTTAESNFFIEQLSKQKPNHLLLTEPCGKTIQQGETNISPDPQMLMQAMFFQGDTRRLSKEPYLKRLLSWAKASPNRKNLRGTFEKILSTKPDDLDNYLNNRDLRI